jgi:hypothetical protein
MHVQVVGSLYPWQDIMKFTYTELSRVTVSRAVTETGILVSLEEKKY